MKKVRQRYLLTSAVFSVIPVQLSPTPPIVPPIGTRTRIRMMLIEVMQNNATSVQQIENLLALHGLQRDKTFESINGMNALYVNTRLSEPWMNATLS